MARSEAQAEYLAAFESRSEHFVTYYTVGDDKKLRCRVEPCAVQQELPCCMLLGKLPSGWCSSAVLALDQESPSSTDGEAATKNAIFVAMDFEMDRLAWEWELVGPARWRRAAGADAPRVGHPPSGPRWSW